MNYLWFAWAAMIVGIVGGLGWLAFILIKKYDVISFLFDKPDVWGLVIKNNHDVRLLKGYRKPVGGKYKTANFVKFAGIKGSYLSPYGKQVGYYKNIPIYLFVEGIVKPFLMIDNYIKENVSAEVVDLAVNTEIGLQLAQGMKEKEKPINWTTIIIIGAVAVVVVVGVFMLGKRKGWW
jgi:hypothetical protein